MNSDESDRVRLFRLDPACRVLGPGKRAAIWVQGCPLGCPGCLVPKSWTEWHAEALDMAIESLADWVVDCDDIEGLTLSGGEPMGQARALAELVRQVRVRRYLGVVCYTGYRMEALRTPEQRDLLAQVDLLIDGPYQAERHADLLWRGSSNQRLLDLTGRYRAFLPTHENDRSAGLEYRIESDGRFSFSGVPPWAGYVTALDA